MNTPTPWTDNARLLLDEWFRRQIPRWRAEGADPDEVQADLRRDLEQRFARHPGHHAAHCTRLSRARRHHCAGASTDR